jgi:hypothetical protein
MSRNIDVDPVDPLRVRFESKHADVIHAHDARSHTLALLASKPLIVSRRVAFPPRRDALSRIKYSRAGLYIAVSEYVKNVLIDSGVPGDRVSVIYDGVVMPQEPAHGTSIVALDSDDRQKGKRLIQDASKLGGFRVCYSKDLIRDLPGAAVFVYITESEGLGSAALLAMAHGVPVIASRVGGLPEIVHDGETGVLIENRPATIALAIGRVLNNPQLAARLGEQGREMVEQRFMVSHMVDSTVRAYERLLS